MTEQVTTYIKFLIIKVLSKIAVEIFAPPRSSPLLPVFLNDLLITLAVCMVALLAQRLQVVYVKEILADRPRNDMVHDGRGCIDSLLCAFRAIGESGAAPQRRAELCPSGSVVQIIGPLALHRSRLSLRLHPVQPGALHSFGFVHRHLFFKRRVLNRSSSESLYLVVPSTEWIRSIRV